MHPNLFQRAQFSPHAIDAIDPRVPDARNAAGADAFAFAKTHALAQYAATGCLQDTFYASAEVQLETVLALCAGMPAATIAKTAIWCRESAHMKDLPAFLCALLTVEDPALCERVFDRVIDDARMLRTFVQVLRSKQVGRGSLASFPKRLVRAWFARRTDAQLFAASIGTSPSLGDVVRLAHPRPTTPSRSALYAWLIGKPWDVNAAPAILQAYAAYVARPEGSPPDVPFLMLTALPLDHAAWCMLARRASWTQLRMSLNTFLRHGVFDRPKLTAELAVKLRNPALIRSARVLPYQLMMAWKAADRVPVAIRAALHDAMEIATENVPTIEGKVFVCPDVSGSMQSPVTGRREGATTAARCVDIAALVAAAILRRKPTAEVLPFERQVVEVKLKAKDLIMKNAARLAAIGGGGTACSAPLAQLNRDRALGELVVFISDNESWADPRTASGTAMMAEWATFKARNPRAKLVCIDIQPTRTTQVRSARDVLNVGGFSDAVFEVVAAFARGDTRSWTQAIEATLV